MTESAYESERKLWERVDPYLANRMVGAALELFFSGVREVEAYRRGVLAGVEVAKRTATTAPELRRGVMFTEIDWTETDREAAKLAGEG